MHGSGIKGWNVSIERTETINSFEQMSFLKAEWRKLAIANYEIERTVLDPFTPKGTELDLYRGKCFVSLVGFMFLHTKLLGLKIPLHTNFEEVNLRFYVKRFDNAVWKRGVVFIKEIVPKSALTFVANTIYKENYETLPMGHTWEVCEQNRTVAYKWKKEGIWQNFLVRSEVTPSVIEPESETEFITEHYWGYARVDQATTNEYEVTHPKWMQYKVHDFEVDVDFGSVYGKAFDFLNERSPSSVMLAEGSKITVESKKTFRK